MQRLARIPAAVFVLVGGVVHLQLWRGGYKGIPYIGGLFLANAGASMIIAAALVTRKDRWVTFAGLLVAVGSLVGLALSRTVGLLGFMESAWTPEAVRTVASEVGAISALVLIAVIDRRSLRFADVRPVA